MNKFIEIKQIDRDAATYLVRELENFEKDEAIKTGLTKAGNVFKTGGRKRLKSRLKHRGQGSLGNLYRSIIVRPKRDKPGVLIGFRQGKDGGSHSHLIDRGTSDRYWKTKKMKYTGRVIGNFFWTDTKSEDHPQALDKLYTGIEDAVNRIKKRQ